MPVGQTKSRTSDRIHTISGCPLGPIFRRPIPLEDRKFFSISPTRGCLFITCGYVRWAAACEMIGDSPEFRPLVRYSRELPSHSQTCPFPRLAFFSRDDFSKSRWMRRIHIPPPYHLVLFYPTSSTTFFCPHDFFLCTALFGSRSHCFSWVPFLLNLCLLPASPYDSSIFAKLLPMDRAFLLGSPSTSPLALPGGPF